MKAQVKVLPLDPTILRRRVWNSMMATALLLALTVPAMAKGAAKAESAFDRGVQQRVMAELAKKERFKNVKAFSEDAIVTLSGTVELYIDKLDAEKRTAKQERVKGVRNEIAVAGKSVADAELREKLANKLRYDRIGFGIMFNHLTLGVENGRATVAGKVRDYSDRDSALAIVATTPGVKDVVDEIEVASVSGFDDDLRLRLARAIYTHPSMTKYAIDPQAPIRIVVDNGRVALHGVVDSNIDKQLALSQARSVSGAFEVSDYLMVKGDTVR
jgi:hyperosmotically inducible protein